MAAMAADIETPFRHLHKQAKHTHAHKQTNKNTPHTPTKT